MVTSKKPTTKKATAKVASKAPAKKTVAKSAPASAAKKKVVAKSTSSKKGTNGYKTLRVATPEESFSSFRITRQTVYWVILIAFIIFVQLWILSLQIDVATLLESQQAELSN